MIGWGSVGTDEGVQAAVRNCLVSSGYRFDASPASVHQGARGIVWGYRGVCYICFLPSVRVIFSYIIVFTGRGSFHLLVSRIGACI